MGEVSRLRTSRQPLGNRAVEINRFRKLLLLDELTIRMRNMNRSWTD